MEDRYEIRGKIGAGGLGTVYRGFDMKMKRQVAIKRIMTSEEDPTIQEEATKQLAAEAGALASLQHPHIVTVYDVGQDEDGPYVVMELINGRTLDEIVEEHALTWADFRELALQTQEALIAAQELNMIHSDLKPPNIMLTWLPSGKFQVKIVDFGLAVLAQNQSKEELETIDTVFGSIFFMPPEQFEREVLDARSDLYSMACVYYQCLTGNYPFMGSDGNEVMEAHLNHTVVPIQDIRADVPIWVCDWVMWQLNRNREDRPQSAKEALAVFLQNNRQSNPEMSTGRPKKAGPKLIIPGADAGDPDAPEPITGRPIVPPGDLETVEMLAALEETEPEPEPESEPAPPKITRAQPTTGILTPTQHLSRTTSVHPTAGQPQSPEPAPVAMPPKPPMSAGAKAVIAIILALAIGIVGWMILGQNRQNADTKRLNALMQQAAAEGTTEVLMSMEDLEMVLKTVSYTGAMENRDGLYNLLIKAKSKTGENFDIAILNHARQDNMLTEVRVKLLSTVLYERNNSDILTLLLDYATETKDKAAAIAAIRAGHMMGNPAQAGKYLDIIIDSPDTALRDAAGRSLGRIIDDTANRDSISLTIATAYDRANDPDVKHTLIRLLGNCSTDIALQKISKALKGDVGVRDAAISALKKWKDMRAVNVLLDYLGSVTEKAARARAYDSLLEVAAQDFVLKDKNQANQTWMKIRDQATFKEEKREFIKRLASLTNDHSAPWAAALVQPLISDADPKIGSYAKSAVDHINEQEKRRKKTGE